MIFIIGFCFDLRIPHKSALICTFCKSKRCRLHCQEVFAENNSLNILFTFLVDFMCLSAWYSANLRSASEMDLKFVYLGQSLILKVWFHAIWIKKVRAQNLNGLWTSIENHMTMEEIHLRKSHKTNLIQKLRWVSFWEWRIVKIDFNVLNPCTIRSIKCVVHTLLSVSSLSPQRTNIEIFFEGQVVGFFLKV